jgi:hypothetical protein
MRIGYLTLDELNESLAKQLAAEFHLVLLRLSFREDSPIDQCDALLYELDYLASEDQQKLISTLVVSTSQIPVAVHGLNMQRRDIKALHSKGIAVFRRLGAGVFRHLRRAVRQSWQATKSPMSLRK